MRHDEAGTSLRDFFKRLFDNRFILAVQGAGRLVENKDGSILENRSGNRDALLLSTRKQRAALAHPRVKPFGQRRQEFVERSRLHSACDVFLRGIRQPVGDIGSNRIVEEEDVLRNNRYLPTQIFEPDAS